MSGHKRHGPPFRRSVRRGPKTSRHPGPGWKTQGGRGPCSGLYRTCVLDKHHPGPCSDGSDDE